VNKIRIDCHNDTVLNLREKKSLRFLPDAHCDYIRLQKELGLAFFALFIHPHHFGDRQTEEILRLLALLLADIKANEDFVYPVFWHQDLQKLQTEVKARTAVLIGAEGGGFLGVSPEILQYFFTLGFRFLGLTWNFRNNLADGCEEDGGLTKMGKTVVRECNRLGILVDAAHLNHKGFWQLLEQSDDPIIVSHTACETLNLHPRNLSDEQLAAIGDQGGVVGISYAGMFLGGQEPTLQDVADHIEYAVGIAGIDHVALGSDFDGATLVKDMNGVQDLPNLYAILSQRGFSDLDIDRISGENIFRVLQEVLPYRRDNI